MSPLRRGVLVLLALLGLLVVAAFVTDYGWARGRVERMVTDKTGRQFKLDDLHVRLGFPIRVRLRGVRFANPEWASEPEMLRVEQAEFSVRMAPLLRGRLVLPEVKLAKPVVDLEESGDGAQNNWTFKPSTPPPEKKPGSALPEIGSIAVDQGLLLFSRPKEGSAVRVLVETAADALDGKPGLRIQAGGTYRKLALEAEAVGAPVLALLDTRTPYPLRAKVRFGGTQASLTGTVTGLASLSAADLQLEAAGESFSDVYPVLGLSLPPTPPYRIKARILRDGAWWRVHDLVGSMGDSDLAGRVDVTYAKQRPYMQADLTSKVLDLDDLAGLVGVPPATGPGETASAGQKQEAARRAASPKLLPDVPFKLERLRAMDADVKFAAESLRNKKNAIDHLSVHAILADGVLRTEPLNFGIGGGGVESRLRVD
ncbi:MAG TPA: AsmA family protein, partial [Candidatus Binatia bacterium]|nr:AsmA family protein [Candidatus Binatia bacterium]